MRASRADLALAAFLCSTSAFAQTPSKAQLVRVLVASKGLSRTYAKGETRLRAPRTTARDVPRIAERNLRDAAALIVEHAAMLPLDRSTAVRINRALTRDLVNDAVRGIPDYRSDSHAFYDWLESKDARSMMQRNPIQLAERVHHGISKADAFADGSGRTARVMADLVLLKAGLAPARYTDVEE